MKHTIRRLGVGVLVVTTAVVGSAFVPSGILRHAGPPHGRDASTTTVLWESSSSSSSSSVETTDAIRDELLELYPEAVLHTFNLTQHRPLGCTVEESLGEGKYVFISKVREDSFGAQGGLQVGDVILACSNVFGNELMQIVRNPEDDNSMDDADDEE